MISCEAVSGGGMLGEGWLFRSEPSEARTVLRGIYRAQIQIDDFGVDVIWMEVCFSDGDDDDGVDDALGLLLLL